MIGHLYRRAGFGLRGDEIAALESSGFNAAVDRLLDRSADPAAATTPSPVFEVTNVADAAETTEQRKARTTLRARQRRDLTTWWLQRMTVTERPLVEKLAFFWHGHFATSIDKVNEARYMQAQNEIFRRLGGGSFEKLTQAVAKDPAMMIWLDANQNRKGSPNENFARELLELFTIGIGSYTDADVREAARAFTGWRIDRRTGAFFLRPNELDAGPKSILGRTEPFNGEQVITMLATHPAAARFVVAKLWSRFAYPVLPSDSVVSDITPVFSSAGDITATMRAIFTHPAFTSETARTGLVKQPVEYVVGTLRALGLQPVALGSAGYALAGQLATLNQVPFDPPSVGGWPQNGYWLSTATSLARLRIANTLVRKSDLAWLRGAPASQRPDLLASRLGLEGWSASTASALRSSSNPVDQLVVALVSPEYVLN